MFERWKMKKEGYSVKCIFQRNHNVITRYFMSMAEAMYFAQRYEVTGMRLLNTVEI